MSDSPYEKECLYCKNKIRMSKESGKWLPYNLNNGQHDCRNNSNPPKQETTAQPFTLEAVQKKLESIGVKLELEKIMQK